MFAYMPEESSGSWLVEALRSSKSLECLNLQNVNLRRNGIGQAGIFLGIVLRSEVHLRLRELHFSVESNRDVEFFDTLAVLLASTAELQILRLVHVWFDLPCTRCFVEGLKSSRTIRSLFLEPNCYFYDDSLSHLLCSKTIRPSILHAVCIQDGNRVDFWQTPCSGNHKVDKKVLALRFGSYIYAPGVQNQNTPLVHFWMLAPQNASPGDSEDRIDFHACGRGNDSMPSQAGAPTGGED
jgi:hypothetical protein